MKRLRAFDWRRYEWVLWGGAALAALVTAVVFTIVRDDGEAEVTEPVYSRANEPPETLASRVAGVIETAAARGDCLLVDVVDARSPASLRCPPGPELRASLSDFKVVGAREYGTGAIVDYKAKNAPGGAAMVLTATPDRFWSVARIGLETDPSTETEDDDSRGDFDEAVERYLAAVRERDCEAFREVAVLSEDARGGCPSAFKSTRALAKRLARNPGAEPSYQGGNETYGFYTLETAKPKRASVTLSVVHADGGLADSSVVLTVSPAPTAAEQRRAERVLRKQWREGSSNPAMEPSSRPKDSPADE